MNQFWFLDIRGFERSGFGRSGFGFLDVRGSFEQIFFLDVRGLDVRGFGRSGFGRSGFGVLVVRVSY